MITTEVGGTMRWIFSNGLANISSSVLWALVDPRYPLSLVLGSIDIDSAATSFSLILRR